MLLKNGNNIIGMDKSEEERGMAETEKNTTRKQYSEAELEYLCKFWEHDGQELMACALDRPSKNLKNAVSRLRKSGKFEFYKNLNKHWC